MRLPTSSQMAAAAAILYLLIAVFTFGHSFNGTSGCNHVDREMSTDAECRSGTGMMAAMVWPLYWSAELQKRRAP